MNNNITLMINLINGTTIQSNTTMTTNEKSLIVYISLRFIMPCAVAIGVIGNLLSILVFARREMIKFCVSIFTIVLALSDILLLTTSLFNLVLPEFYGPPLSDKSSFWCHFHGYFDLLFAALSGYSMVCISLERWFSVWKPFEKAKYVTFKTTILTVFTYTSISMVAFLWFPLTLNYEAIVSNNREKCQLIRPTVYKILGTASVIFTYIVPFVFLGILNTLIVYRLHARHNTSIQRSMVPSSSTTGNDLTLGSASTRKRQRQKNVDRNITFMLIAVAFAFMIMSFPYQIYWFYMQIRQSLVPNYILFNLTQTCRYLNCCCNFFLYSATSSLFRRELREIFQCCLTSTKNAKQSTVEHGGLVNRTRTPSSPPVHPSTTIDQRTVERKQLLSTTTTITSKKINNQENTLSIEGPTNGHIVTFQT